MNVADAEDAVTEAVEHRDEAARLLAKAESALFVAETNRDTARKHYAAMVAWVAQRERVLREITIATDGGYTP
ncbi:hypothetical protein J2Y46_002567 [Microbacterium sp. BE35]|uniref:hypothetical protein n=1 Tax=Microbacterium sp. BE35 TaxID=2817773 RepID=UPI00285F7F69|nr:hypothetical protein [Microbacterium sp. BE35]MDR7189741.1 hypothetical protein [Microbacterium sp. BE35]